MPIPAGGGNEVIAVYRLVVPQQFMRSCGYDGTQSLTLISFLLKEPAIFRASRPNAPNCC